MPDFDWLAQNINEHQLINGFVHVVLLSGSLLFYESYTLWMINERLWTHDVSIGRYLMMCQHNL